MTLDFADPRLWLHAVQLLALLLLWVRKPGENALQVLPNLDSRLQVLEERVRHMPTADELTELEGTVKAIQAQLGGMQETAKATREAVTRIEIFLRDNK